MRVKGKKPPSQRDKRSHRVQKPKSFEGVARRRNWVRPGKSSMKVRPRRNSLRSPQMHRVFSIRCKGSTKTSTRLPWRAARAATTAATIPLMSPSPKLVIARTLQQRSPEEVERVKQLCRDYIARSSPGLAILNHVQPCPLLVKGLCSVYEKRPLACRGFFSESVEPCRRGITEPNTTTMSPPGIGVTWAAYEAVQRALSEHRLDGRRFSLPKVSPVAGVGTSRPC